MSSMWPVNKRRVVRCETSKIVWPTWLSKSSMTQGTTRAITACRVSPPGGLPIHSPRSHAVKSSGYSCINSARNRFSQSPKSISRSASSVRISRPRATARGVAVSSARRCGLQYRTSTCCLRKRSAKASACR